MNKIDYLRHIIANIEVQPPPETMVEVDLQKTPFVKAHMLGTGHTIGILKEAGHALYKLTDAIFGMSEEYQRGATFGEIS